MLVRRSKFQKYSNSSMFLGLVLLIGVLTMSYGFFNKFNPVLYAGLAVTVAGSFYSMLWLMVFRKVSTSK